jgi:hypothetical protein
MHECNEDIPEKISGDLFHEDIFSDNLLDNCTPVQPNLNLKDYTNKGYSFPRYLSKYKGFIPSTEDKKNCNNHVEITSKDIKRIIGYNNENIHNYFM